KAYIFPQLLLDSARGIHPYSRTRLLRRSPCSDSRTDLPVLFCFSVTSQYLYVNQGLRGICSAACDPHDITRRNFSQKFLLTSLHVRANFAARVKATECWRRFLAGFSPNHAVLVWFWRSPYDLSSFVFVIVLLG